MRVCGALCCLLLLLPLGGTVAEVRLPGEGYDAGVPRPAEILGFEVGDWHVRHDQLVRYMEVLAESSPRASLREIGRTHEGRRLVHLIVSSPQNLARIDLLRQQHLDAIAAGDNPDGPLIVWHGCSVHGNEPSGANMSLLLAYHLAAGGGAVEKLLKDTIVIIDPALNPDGVARFAQWVNSHRGRTPNGDPQNREHLEVWPNGRTNHYWFDLNRDWLLLTHPESRARVEQFHRWRPHVLTDFHEMGSDATYFFQPGVPSRRHPWTPERNQELTARIGEYHARALDREGQLYYSEETFDDFYYGKGSTYPDVNGTVGILFEQASSRGHLMDTDHGPLTFPRTIQNQLTTALSTLEAADALRDELKSWQAEFGKEALALAEQDAEAAYVVGDGGDPRRAQRLIEILRQHRIDVRELASTVQLDGERFEPGAAWVVPLRQPQYRLIKAIFERRTRFEDETFYDVSAFNLPMSFNLPYRALGRSFKPGLVGSAASERKPTAFAGAENAIAYAFSWDGYFAPRALQRLLTADVAAYVATEPLTVRSAGGERRLGRGSIVVPVGSQPGARQGQDGVQARAGLERHLARIAELDGVDVLPISSGLTPAGIDLGSPRMERLRPIRAAMLVGRGVSGYEAGEVWHLLDTRVELPLSMIERERFSSVDLDDYTHLILVNGSYDRIDERGMDRLRRWISAGGVLVATKGAAIWASRSGLHRGGPAGEEAGSDPPPAHGATKPPPSESEDRPYAEHRQDRARHVIGGAIFQVELDTTHPIAYGYRRSTLPVFRNSTAVLEAGDNPYEIVARYGEAPLLAGYASEERQHQIANTPAILATRVGDGAVILMVDNPNFRGVWYGTNKLFLNGLFFGGAIDRTAAPESFGEPRHGHVH